jgi:iron complex transport system permease protein
MESIIFNVRLPRILASVMIGAMLSLSGAVYQSVFRNPLVSPDLLGVSSGAAVGAAGAILLGQA